jgi:hypothetical protein
MQLTQKDVILFFVLLVFLFGFLYWCRQKEGFGYFDEMSPTEIKQSYDVVPGSDSLDGILLFQDQWMNSEIHGNIIRIRWDDLSFNVHEKRSSKKNSEFSVSFWLYLHDTSRSSQPIFRVCDPVLGVCDLPGVWLVPNQSSVQIRQQGRKMSKKNVADISIPQKSLDFYTFTFSSNNCSVYKNGDLQIIMEGVQSRPTSGNTFVDIGGSNGNKYVMRDIQIFDDIFTAQNATNLYEMATRKIGDLEVAKQAAVDIFTTKKQGFTGYIEAMTTNKEDNWKPWHLINNNSIMRNPIWDRNESSANTAANDAAWWARWGVKPTTNSSVGSSGYEAAMSNKSDFGGLPDTLFVADGGNNFILDFYQLMTSNKKPYESVPYLLGNGKGNEEVNLYYYRFERTKKEHINLYNSERPIVLGNKGLSFAMWFKYDKAAAKATRLFDFGNGPKNDNNIIAEFDTNGRLTLNVYNGSTLSSAQSVALDLTNQWYHLAWVISPPADYRTGYSTWDVYINGETQHTYERKFYPVTNKLSNWEKYVSDNYKMRGMPQSEERANFHFYRVGRWFPGILADTTDYEYENMFIGKGNNDENDSFDGLIADFRILNQAIGIAEVREIFKNPTNPTK